MLLLTSISVLVAYQLTPRYTATSEVLIDPRERKVTDVEAVLAGLSSDVGCGGGGCAAHREASGLVMVGGCFSRKTL